MSEFVQTNSDTGKRGVIRYKEVEEGIVAKAYNGVMIEMSLEKHNEMKSEIKKAKDEADTLRMEVGTLKDKNNLLEAEIKELEKRFAKQENQMRAYLERQRKFEENRGKSQKNVVLTPRVKKAIEKLYKEREAKKMSLMDIYKALVLHGYKGTYESVRKYVAENAQRDEWL